MNSGLIILIVLFGVLWWGAGLYGIIKWWTDEVDLTIGELIGFFFAAPIIGWFFLIAYSFKKLRPFSRIIIKTRDKP